MDYEYVTVSLAQLQLNTDNDRHGPLPSQRDCIQWMLQHIGDEIYSLAKDISKNGLSPLDSILLIPAGDDTPDEYVVWEGNRRITALKLLDDPSRCENEKLTQRFRELRSGARQIPRELICVVAPSIEDADRLIELRHLGPQGGVGTVPWNGAQKSRHMARRGKRGRYAYTQEVIDAVLDKLDDDLRNEVQQPGFPISTLDRLLRNDEVRQFLGLLNQNGKPQRILAEEETLKGLTKILRDISEGLPVAKVYNNELQRAYIESFGPDHRPDQAARLESPVLVEAPPESAARPAPSRPRSKPSARDRKKLIPPEVRYRINDHRLNDIYLELRDLKIHDFPNAVAVLFRVFLELATELYLEHHKIPYHSYNDKLHQKVTKAVDHAVGQGWLTKDTARGIRTQISQRDSLFGADALNAYVHSSNFHPMSRELNAQWDNCQPYLDAILGHLD